MASSAKEKHSSKNVIDMCNGPILPQLIRFSIPLIIIGIVQLMFSAADMMVVGYFAENADDSLAAVGSTGSLIALVTCIFTGMSAGTNVLSARYFGSKKYDDLSKVIHNSVILALIVGTVLTTIGLLFMDTFLVWMSTPKDILPLASLYLKIYMLGSIPVLLYNFCAAVLRSVGDTTRPMWILLISGASNVLLNIVFVAAFHLDVAGVAIATFLTQTMSAVLVLICLIKDKGPINLSLSNLKFDKKTMLDISRIGFPTGIQNSMFTLANVLIQKAINSYDTASALAGKTAEGVIVTGCSIASNVDNLSIAITDAIFMAVISFTSQNFGAHNFDRIKKAQKYSHLITLCAVLPIGIITCIFAEPLLNLFTGNASAEAIAIGAKRVIFVGGCSFIYGFARVSGGGMRGFGIALTPTITSLVSICGVRILWIYTAFQVWNDSIFNLYIAFPLSFFTLFVVDTVCFWMFYKRFAKRYSEPELAA